MEQNFNFDVNLIEMYKGNVGLPYEDPIKPKPNLCIPVKVKLFDRIWESGLFLLFSLMFFICGGLLITSSLKENSILMLISGILFCVIGCYVIYDFVFKYITLKRNDVLVLVKHGDDFKVYKLSKESQGLIYNLKEIKGIWISNRYVNGLLNTSTIQLSQTPYNRKKNYKTKTPCLSYPEIHPLVEVVLAINTLIVYDFIQKYFSEILIGFHEKENDSSKVRKASK